MQSYTIMCLNCDSIVSSLVTMTWFWGFLWFLPLYPLVLCKLGMGHGQIFTGKKKKKWSKNISCHIFRDCKPLFALTLLLGCFLYVVAAARPVWVFGLYRAWALPPCCVSWRRNKATGFLPRQWRNASLWASICYFGFHRSDTFHLTLHLNNNMSCYTVSLIFNYSDEYIYSLTLQLPVTAVVKSKWCKGELVCACYTLPCW